MVRLILVISFHSAAPSMHLYAVLCLRHPSAQGIAEAAGEFALPLTGPRLGAIARANVVRPFTAPQIRGTLTERKKKTLPISGATDDYT